MSATQNNDSNITITPHPDLKKRVIRKRADTGTNQIIASREIGIGLVTLRSFEQSDGDCTPRTAELIEKWLGKK